MPRIQQLPPSVITKIAAGEVIERPASVVKELLENSVDAGSSRIDIDIEQGGVELIRVVDNGCGILADDLPLAFASHATSKLSTAEDLFRVHTLGFRGEALASIGGVAQVTLQSRPAEQDCGAELNCHGGELAPVRVWNGDSGTRIEVRHLFFNTPVRRKFLRTTATETGHVCEVFTRLALAQPALHLTLRHNGKEVYEVTPPADLLSRIGLFFGAEVRDRLHVVEMEAGPAKLRGYVADPACERGNAKLQYLFVNGRWVRDRSLGHALQEAYRGLLMTGRYAVAFLFVELPPDQVDVNIHPTKAEVRFRDGQAIYHLVLTAIRDRLRRENLTARLQLPLGSGQSMASGQWRVASTRPEVGSGQWAGSSAEKSQEHLGPSTADGSREGPSGGMERSEAAPWALSAPPPPGPVLPLTAPDTRPLPTASSLPSAHCPLPTTKAIQLYDAYLVLETPEGMLVIDRHALHERILFEQLKKRMRSGSLETQRLLVPEPVDLPADQAARTLEHQEALAELGLGVEDFGGGTVLVTTYPAVLGNRPPQAILRAVVDYLVSKDRLPNREQLLHDLLSLMACHAAVRAGDRLTAEEIAALVDQRDLAKDTHHCPHGRPASLLFSRHELDRQFRRL